MSEGAVLLILLLLGLGWLVISEGFGSSDQNYEPHGESLTEKKERRRQNRESKEPRNNEPETDNNAEENPEEDLEDKIEELREQAGLESTPDPDFRTDRD